MTDASDDEGWKKWRGLIAFAVIAGALYGASRIDAARPYEAMIVAMAFPLAVIVGGLLPMREAGTTLRAGAVIVALVAVAAAELELSEVFFPGAPVATAELTTASPDARIAWPADGRPLDFQVHGQLRDEHGSATGHYAVVLTRGRDEQTIAGQISRTVTQGRRAMRRGAPVSSVVSHMTDRHDVSMRGTGSVRVHLDSAEGLAGPVRITLREPPAFDRWIVVALAALVVIGAVIEGIAVRAGLKPRLAGALGATSVLAWYVVHRFDQDDPLVTVVGGVLVALLAGGVGGLLLGKLAAMIVVRPPAAPTPPAAAAR